MGSHAHPSLALGVLVFVMHASGAAALNDRWHIDEIYSNADGSVQFVELLGEAIFQQFLAIANGFLMTDDITFPFSERSAE